MTNDHTPRRKETHVLYFTQWFDPEPAMRGAQFVRELARDCGRVEVITGFPNYPGGEIYPGYKIKLWQSEEADGYRLKRLPLYPSHNSRALHRIANYLSFAFSVFVYGLFALRRAKVVYVYHPPLTVGLAVALANLFHRKPLVLDIQDLWPDTLSATGMINNGRVLTMVGTAANWLYRQCNRIIVLSPGFRERLIERGVPAEKLVHIYNWAPDEVASRTAPPGEAVYTLPKDRLNIVYAGNMGPAQGLLPLLPALVAMQTAGSKVHFNFIGGGIQVEEIRRFAATHGLENLTLYPPVPHAQIGAILQQADALLVSLNRDPLFDITIPSKLMSYLNAGKPIIGALRGDAGALVARAEAGMQVIPEDAASLEAAVTALAALDDTERKALAANARNYYVEHLSMAAGTSRIAEVLRRVAP